MSANTKSTWGCGSRCLHLVAAMSVVLATLLLIWCSTTSTLNWVEGLTTRSNANFKSPRAYFHPFSTEYESYSRAWLPPWDPRVQRDDRDRMLALLSAEQ